MEMKNKDNFSEMELSLVIATDTLIEILILLKVKNGILKWNVECELVKREVLILGIAKLIEQLKNIYTEIQGMYFYLWKTYF